MWFTNFSLWNLEPKGSLRKYSINACESFALKPDSFLPTEHPLPVSPMLPDRAVHSYMCHALFALGIDMSGSCRGKESIPLSRPGTLPMCLNCHLGQLGRTHCTPCPAGKVIVRATRDCQSTQPSWWALRSVRKPTDYLSYHYIAVIQSSAWHLVGS